MQHSAQNAHAAGWTFNEEVRGLLHSFYYSVVLHSIASSNETVSV
jgi:hypothetical protein